MISERGRTIKPDDDALRKQMYLAQEQGLDGARWKTVHPGTTYEQGVSNALRWAPGQVADKPVEP